MMIPSWLVPLIALVMLAAIAVLALALVRMALDCQTRSRSDSQQWADHARLCAEREHQTRTPELRHAELEKEVYALRVREAELRRGEPSMLTTNVAGVPVSERQRHAEFDAIDDDPNG